jgi:hypothetical protein
MAVVKTIIFTILVPGSATILAPYLLVSSGLAQHRCDIGLFRLAGFVPCCRASCGARGILP